MHKIIVVFDKKQLLEDMDKVVSWKDKTIQAIKECVSPEETKGMTRDCIVISFDKFEDLMQEDTLNEFRSYSFDILKDKFPNTTFEFSQNIIVLDNDTGVLNKISEYVNNKMLNDFVNKNE